MLAHGFKWENLYLVGTLELDPHRTDHEPPIKNSAHDWYGTAL
jgi:hypothetical protein